MTLFCILLGICLGGVITLFIKNIKHARRLDNLEFIRRCHATTITELEREIEKLKKEE